MVLFLSLIYISVYVSVSEDEKDEAEAEAAGAEEELYFEFGSEGGVSKRPRLCKEEEEEIPEGFSK